MVEQNLTCPYKIAVVWDDRTTGNMDPFCCYDCNLLYNRSVTLICMWSHVLSPVLLGSTYSFGFIAGYLKEPELSPLQLCLENVHRTLQRSGIVLRNIELTFLKKAAIKWFTVFPIQIGKFIACLFVFFSVIKHVRAPYICISTESTRKLTNFYFQWTKTLYQNNLKNNYCILFFIFHGLN